MTFIKYVVTLVGIIYILPACYSNKESRIEKSSLELVKVDSVTLKQGGKLFGEFFEQLKITSDGKYYLFSERIKNQIFVFKSTGSFYTTIGEEGRGPKGLLEVTGYDINKYNEVLVFDSSQRMLKVFGLEGNLLKSTKILEGVTYNPTANNILWYNDKILATVYDTEVGLETHKSKLIGLINIDGSLNTVFGRFDSFSKQDNQLAFNTLIALDEKNDLAYSNLQTSPYFQVYDLASKKRILYGGHQTKSFNIPSKEINPHMPLSKKFELSENTSGIMHIFLTDHYFVQHMQILTEEWFKTVDYTKKKNVLVVYDRETNEFVEEIPVKHTLCAVQNNKLYLIEDFAPDNYTIGIYELVSE